MPINTPFKIRYSIVDAHQKRQNGQLYGMIDNDVSLLNSATALGAVLYYLLQLIDGSMTISELVVPVLPTLPVNPIPLASAEVENTGLYRFASYDGVIRPLAVDLPTAKRSMYVGDKLDLSHYQVTHFTDIMQGDGRYYYFTDPYGVRFGSIENGQLVVRPSNGGRVK